MQEKKRERDGGVQLSDVEVEEKEEEEEEDEKDKCSPDTFASGNR